MKALEKGAWLNLSFLPSSGKNFLLLHVNRKREEVQIEVEKGFRWNRFSRCSCSTLMW